MSGHAYKFPLLHAVLHARLIEPSQGQAQWAIDVPKNGLFIDQSPVRLSLQGWLLVPPSADLTLVRALVYLPLDASIDPVEIPFTVKRPDVITRVLHESVDSHPQLTCGFNARVPFPAQGFRFGYRVGDEPVVWVSEVTFVQPDNLVVGHEGWLFLDNDTNHSVDQFTGQKLLQSSDLANWQAYYDGCRALAARAGARHAMVVAPSKEEVLPHRYPYARAPLTVLDQVCSLATPADHLLNAAPLLAAHQPPEDCFRRNDTHWTDRGALLAALAALQALGLDEELARQCFAADEYEVLNAMGDLGVKIGPGFTAPTEFLKGPPPEGGAGYDNRLPNFGRVLVYEQEAAPYPQRLLMFGASSSYPMLKYLKRLFRRVVFVHSAAQVDPLVVEHERPDLLLLQSNARFLVQPPHLGFNLVHTMKAKLAEASPAVQAHAAELVAAKRQQPAYAWYAEMLENALD